MKKSIIYLLLSISICFLLTGCGNKGYVEISYSELQNKIAKEENIVLFVGRTSCSACSIYKDVLNEHASDHKGIVFYYIDLDKLEKEELAKFDSVYDYSRTPTTFVLVKGKLESNSDKVTGYKGYNDVINLIKKKGLI